MVQEDSQRDHRQTSLWQIRYHPDIENNNNVAYDAEDTIWPFVTRPSDQLIVSKEDKQYEMISIAIVSPDFLLDDCQRWQAQVLRLYRDLRSNNSNMCLDTSGQH